ncbi:hypothetical protein [Clostridium perfringens]|uniref:hypothetical protein n=1 Tax=Clostridium perfringens TaxID=1502 RepID=UPI0030CF42E9
MFEYTVTSGEFKINTPFCTDLKQINYEVISMTPECIHGIYKYPNGFVYESWIYSDKLIARTNMPLIKNPDGSFDVQL